MRKGDPKSVPADGPSTLRLCDAATAVQRPEACTDGAGPDFTAEADAFLASVPSGLQARQTAAVQQAVAGDSSALDAVRRSRRGRPPLPGGVEARDIAPWLRLYAPAGSLVPSGRTGSVASAVPSGADSAGPGTAAEQPLPLLVYFHGGGWAFGGIDSCARFCGELAATGRALVLAAEYRLAPEHPFPQGLDDCAAAVERAYRHVREWGGDPALVSVGGDSAGGNLAVAVALRRRAEGSLPLRSLLLFYPVVKALDTEAESWKRYGTDAGLDGGLMEAFARAYASGQECDPLVSVALAADGELGSLPPLLLVAAERDILRDQGAAFVQKLRGLGVAARRVELAGAVHLFITVAGQEAAFRRSVALAADFLAG